MPIRTQRGRASAYRGLWQWPLRSPARLAMTATLVLATALGVTLLVGLLAPPAAPTAAGADPTTGPSARSGTAAPARPRTPTVLPPVPELAPTELPLDRAPTEAMAVAARWSAAWLRPADGTSSAQWIEGLRPLTTDEYLGVLAGVDPANIPATRVTAEPRAVRVAPRSVQVEVATDALTLIVLVVDTEAGWRVSGYDRG